MSDAALRTPGLYLRALEPQAPAPSRTALTAFVGVTARGPLDSPQIVGSFGDFVTVFGEVWSHGAVGEGVYGFFLNGGEEAAVVRVARPAPLAVPPFGTCAGKAELATAAAVGSIVDAGGAVTLALSARNPGSWGNALQAAISADAARVMELGRLTASAAGAATDIVVDGVYDYRVGGTVRLVHATNVFLKSTHRVTAIDETLRRLTLDPALPAGGYPSGSTVAGPGFRLAVTDGARSEVFDGLSMNPTHPQYFVDAVNGPANLPYLELGRRGHSLLVVVTQVFGPAGQSRFKPADTVAPPIPFAAGADGLTFATGTLNDAGGATASVLATALIGGRAGAGVGLTAAPFAGRLSLAVPSEAGGAKDRLFVEDIAGWIAGDPLTITHATNPAVTETATTTSVDPGTHEVRLGGALVNDYPLASTVTVAGRFNLRIEPPPAGAGAGGISSAALPVLVPESFFNLSMAAGPRLFTAVVNGAVGGSRLVCLSPAPGAVGPPLGTVALGAGSDPATHGSDPDEVPLPVFTGYAADGSLFQPAGATGPVGMAALEAVTAVNLVTVSDLVRRADLSLADRLLGQTQALFHCQKMGERFALLDVPVGLEPAQVLEWPEHFTDARLARFGALYYPWVELAVAGGDRLVPPSGIMAGLFARVDRQGGVGQAPANVQLKGAIGLAHDVDAEAQGALNDAGVNCVRKFEVGAVRLWGARTLSRDDQYLYVHNRRVVLLVIKGLSVGLRWAVFEPNGPTLQRRVKATIEGFLRGVLARGLSSGGRPEDAFFVNVGDDLNTPATRDAGQLVAEVGIAVAKPAEFIVITVKRTPDILSLVEEEA